MDNQRKTLIDRIALNIKENGDSLAIYDENSKKRITYNELWGYSSNFMKILSSKFKNPSKNKKIAINLEKGWKYIVVLIAIQRLGYTTILIDTTLPKSRINSFLEEVDPDFVVNNENCTCKIFQEMVFEEQEKTSSDTQLPNSLKRKTEIAFISSTSGSTGSPKSVCLSYDGMDLTIDTIIEHAKLNGGVKGTWFTSPGYGMIEVDPLPILAAGGELFIPNEIVSKDIFKLSNWIMENKISNALLMTSVAETIWSFNINLPYLKCLMIAGERCKNFPPKDTKYRVLNVYGSAEAAVVTISELKPNIGGVVPTIGKPVKGVGLHVVDNHGNKVEFGESGELVITGKTLSKGYLNNIEATNEVFKENTLDDLSDKQYFTKDRAMVDADGNFIILGRMDSLVKIRGNRVDLLELEYTVTEIPEVRKAACVFDDSDEQFLHLIVESDVEDSKKDNIKNRILSHIIEYLPNFYIPHTIHFMDIPLNINDKTDYNNLKAQIYSKDENIQNEEDSISSILKKQWLKWTKSDSDNLESNFFYSGGDSLKLMRMFGELSQKYGYTLEMSEFLENPTLGFLMDLANSSNSSVKKKLTNPYKFLNSNDNSEEFKLNESQQSLWIGRGNSFKYGGVGCQGYFEWEVEKLDFEKFKGSVDTLIKRHEMLRVYITSLGNQRTIHEYDIDRVIFYKDLSQLDEINLKFEIKKIREEFSNNEIGATTWPLFKFLVTKYPNNKYGIHFVIDMLIADAWSIFQVIIPDLIDLYNSSENNLPELNISFKEYVIYKENLKNTDAYLEDKEYWLKKITTLPPAPKLPLYENQVDSNHKFKRFEGYLGCDEVNNLNKISKEMQISKSSIVALVLCEVLRLWGEEEDFTLNFPVSDRLPISEDIDYLVGDFTNTLLVPYTVPKDKTLREKAAFLQREIWESLDHRLFSGVEVLRELARINKSGREPLMPIVLTSLIGHPGRHDSSLFGKEVYGVSQTPQVMLDVQIRESAGKLYYKWDYLSNVIREDVLKDMFKSFETLLLQLAVSREVWDKKEVNLLPREQILIRKKINATSKPLPDVSLSELILKRLSENSSSTAIIEQDGSSFSWRKIVESSLRVKQIIKERAESSECYIGIILSKSSLQYISIYGCVLSGRGYVPIDPDLPNERIVNILKKANIKTIISSKKLDIPVNQILIDKNILQPESIDASTLSSCTNHNHNYSPYIIFTSGSTGEPKGVEIPEKAVINHIYDVNDRFKLNCNTRHLATAAIYFDMSVFDIFGPLVHGGSVVIPKTDLGPDPDSWLFLQNKYNINFWACVPALMELICMINQGDSVVPSMKTIIMAGDWITLNLLPKIIKSYPNSKIYSCGGPTETTNWSIIHEISENEGSLCNSVVYGAPMRNSKYKIVTLGGWEDRPNWVAGEMVVESDISLSNGYVGDKTLTDQQFMINPKTQKRSYRTGDLGRYLPNGEIEILGRIDNQIKINGLRIELGEIERVAEEEDGVERACAFSIKDKITGKPKTISLALLSDDKLAIDRVKQRLKMKLPKYMIPKNINTLSAFPLSKNGKVNIKKLREMDGMKGKLDMNNKNITREVLNIFAEQLNQKIILPQDNFIDIGGDSLSAMQISLILTESLGVEISLQDIILSNEISEIIDKIALEGGRDEGMEK